jgi:hypothetical protein
MPTSSAMLRVPRFTGIRAPLAILAVVVYVLGAATGGTLYALLRKLDAGLGRACKVRRGK